MPSEKFTPARRSAIRAAVRLLAAGAVAVGLSACSLFSSNKTPEPKPLEPNVALFAVSQVWTHQIGALGDIRLTPLVRDADVTLATGNGTVVGLHGITGEELWRVNLGERLTAGVGGDGRTYAVVSVQNEVIALRDGQELWRHRLPARSYTAPLVAGGRVFVLTADRSVLALDADNGAQIWLRENNDEALALQQSILMTAVRDTLVVGYSGRMVGLNPDSGSIRWEAPLAIPRGTNDIERLVDLVGSFSREGENLCAQAFQTAIGCVDARSGGTRWTQRLNGAVGVGGNADAVFSVETNGRLQAWQRGDGKNLWLSDRLQYRRLSAPLVLGRAVVVGDSTGLLHLLETSDGSPLNRFQTNSSGISVAPFHAGNTLIAVTNNGAVYGFRPD
ncbi:outer membrane protein assembly factor BamB [Corticibacter populi]|uniref:Outer membrane protein assembly factor BamB n=1 Tax=Corticibacter populi TaxID=1550736 RepID=A0A3M6R0U5_9BURK|nr:outer membrane protein assembly factor BamB [Corticibacter populi]RMX08831.1 outer membrane protein assembly factor BamB [Corticibacter populi]